MNTKHIVVEVLPGRDGKPDHVWAVKVWKPSEVFHEEFPRNSESTMDMLNRLLDWAAGGVPAQQEDLQIVACSPFEFALLTAEHPWLSKSHCLCFATYVAALTGLTVDTARWAYFPLELPDARTARMPKLALDLQKFLNATSAVKELIQIWPSIRASKS